MRSRLPGTLAALALTLGASAWLLQRPLAVAAEVFWGPERPFVHRDFLGAWWLFWAEGRPGGAEALLAEQNWPDGGLPLRHHIPNPFDAWLLGPLVAEAPAPLWWNLVQLGHHGLNLGATVLLARAVGARWGPAALAGALAAATPLMLHEIAGGRMLSGAVWPGLLCLVALLGRWRGSGLVAGLLLGLQALCYAYHAVIVGVIALILRPRAGLLAAGLLALPYLAWLGPVGEALSGTRPPAGYTSLPLGALLGLAEVPPHQGFLPPLLLGLAGPWLHRRASRAPAVPRVRARRPRPAPGGAPWRWSLAAGLALLVALGPELLWSRGGSGPASPLAWLMWASPELSRMHHPVRAGLLAVPLLAVGLARGLGALPWSGAWSLLGLAAVCLGLRGEVERAASFEAGPTPPGAEAAAWVAAQPGPGAVVDLGAVLDPGAGHAEALALQPVHGRPVLTGFRAHAPGREATSRRLHEGLRAAEARGGGLDEELQRALLAAGYRWILVVDRGRPGVDPAFLAPLGEPVAPGVFDLEGAP